MDEKLKESLEKALNSGKDALSNLKEIIKNITKDMVEKSKGETEDLKNSAGNLFKNVVNSLGELGKDSAKYLKAAASGIKEGLKESSNADNNLLGALGTSMMDSLKNLGDAGIYVTKETAKSLSKMVEDFFKKNKDESKEEEGEEDEAENGQDEEK